MATSTPSWGEPADPTIQWCTQCGHEMTLLGVLNGQARYRCFPCARQAALPPLPPPAVPCRKCEAPLELLEHTAEGRRFRCPRCQRQVLMRPLQAATPVAAERLVDVRTLARKSAQEIAQEAAERTLRAWEQHGASAG